MTDYIGQQFGPYRLLRLIGQGGFADVYLGEHIHLGSFAAVKILYARLIDEHHEHFLYEARTLARLVHPHIIRLLDFGIEDGIPFLIMEYAPHGNLQQRHPTETILPLLTVVDYVNQIAEGLQYAHDQNLIHRDLKPSNVLIGQGNALLLSDFGVALIAQTTYSQSLANAVVGTVAYIAPEQLQGKPQLASDQYSLGIIVYEWLCGLRPFHGTVIEMWAQHQSATPAPLRQYVPDLPPEVEQVVLTALAKDPSRRFGSVRAFVTALEAASRPESIAVIPSTNVQSTQVAADDKEIAQAKVTVKGDTPQSTDITEPDEPVQSPHVLADTMAEESLALQPVSMATPARYGRKKRVGAAMIIAVVLLLIASTFVYASESGWIVSTPDKVLSADNGTSVVKDMLSPTALPATPTPHTTHPNTAVTPHNTHPNTASTPPNTTSTNQGNPTNPPNTTSTTPAIEPTLAPAKPTAVPTPTPQTSFAVDGQNPTTYQVGGKTCAATQSNSTPQSIDVGGVTGTLYFQFSDTCHAAWAKVIFAKTVPTKDYGNAKIIRNNDGKSYTCNQGGNEAVEPGQTSCYTGMVYDGPGKAASAFASFTFSNGQTDTSPELGPY
jgi:serine/threonine protein kinase